MVVKSFKRTISLLLSLIFVLSCVPVVGMAEEIVYTDDTVDMINLVNTKSDNPGDGNQLAYTSYTNTIRISSSQWNAYGQFDLSGYEEILENENTTVTFEMTVGGQFRTHTPAALKIYLMDDSCDYFTSDITYTDAGLLGLHDPDKNGQIISDVADQTYSIGDTHKTEDIKAEILKALRQGKDNSRVTFVFTTTSTNTFFLRDSAKLTIKYNAEEIDDDAYAEEVKDEIKWSDISQEDIAAVTQNLTLPTTLYGADISWQSSKDAVINSVGVVTQSYEKEAVTLTANVTYKDSAVSSCAFPVTVDKLVYEYTDVNTGNANFVTLYSGSTGFTTQHKDIRNIGGKTSGDVALWYRDLGNDDKIIGYTMKDTVDFTQNNDVFEFSILLPTGTDEVEFRAAVFKPDATENKSGSNQSDFVFNITSNGLFYNGNKIYDTRQNEWYNIAIVAPRGMATPGSIVETDDRTSEFYVNGELRQTINCDPTGLGFRYLRFYGSDETLEDAGFYLDNIRPYSGDYVPARDSIPSVTSTTYSIASNVITLSKDANITAAQLKAAVRKDEDTVLRIYNSKTNVPTELSDDAVVTSGNVLVAATTNGTNLEKGYSYYTINKADYSIDADILVNDASANTFGASDTVSAEVVFTNYYAETQYVKLYVAQYKNNELIGLWEDTKTVSMGGSEILSSNLDGFTDKEGSTLKLILVSDETFAPYIIPVEAQYK